MLTLKFLFNFPARFWTGSRHLGLRPYNPTRLAISTITMPSWANRWHPVIYSYAGGPRPFNTLTRAKFDYRNWALTSRSGLKVRLPNFTNSFSRWYFPVRADDYVKLVIVKSGSSLGLQFFIRNRMECALVKAEACHHYLGRQDLGPFIWQAI